MAGQPQPSAQSSQQAAALQNSAARQLILANALDEWQQLFSNSFTSGPGTVINVPLRNVGLNKRLVVEVAATISGSAGVTHKLTTLGLANFFSQVILTDLSNQQRINTSGWHLTAIASAKARLPYGSAVTALDTPFGYGNNYTQVQSAPALITGTQSASNVFHMLEIPLAYSDSDLRGAIYANVVNATFQVQLVVNSNMFVTSTADATLAVYQSNGTTLATLPTFTVTIYQNYLDQIPIGKNGAAILPLYDLSTAYLLNNTTLSAIVANSQYPIPYANFRNFLSTTVVYDNGGVLNPGTDILNFSIQSANFTNIIQIDPKIVSLWARLRLQDDFPTGMYYFDHRTKPLNTIQYGNLQLIVTPTTAGANAAFLVGFESMALINQVTNAGSLPGN
jgi:hypothetical protein